MCGYRYANREFVCKVFFFSSVSHFSVPLRNLCYLCNVSTGKPHYHRHLTSLFCLFSYIHIYLHGDRARPAAEVGVSWLLYHNDKT